MGKLEAIEILHDFAREIPIIVKVYKFHTFMPHMWLSSAYSCFSKIQPGKIW
jgi:hypothetical protein